MNRIPRWWAVAAVLVLPGLGIWGAAQAAAEGQPLTEATAAATPAHGQRVSEPHQRLVTAAPGHERDVALTLDACSGPLDQRLIDTLIRLRVPATLFVTQRWLQRNASGLALLNAHADQFELEDHGLAHVPLVVGGRLYGMAGVGDAAAAAHEVQGGAEAVRTATGRAPQWFRGAGAAYDAGGLAAVRQAGLRVAGFSVNGDDGAKLSASGVAARLARLQPGDIVLMHMNHPESGAADALAATLPALLERGLRFVRLSQAAGVADLQFPPADRARRQPAALAAEVAGAAATALTSAAAAASAAAPAAPAAQAPTRRRPAPALRPTAP